MAGPGDGRSARGGGGLDGLRGGDAGRQGDGERPDERVARPHGVDSGHAEAFDGDRADLAVCAGQGGAVRADGDHGVTQALADKLGSGQGGAGWPVNWAAQDGRGF